MLGSSFLIEKALNFIPGNKSFPTAVNPLRSRGLENPYEESCRVLQADRLCGQWVELNSSQTAAYSYRV